MHSSVQIYTYGAWAEQWLVSVAPTQVVVVRLKSIVCRSVMAVDQAEKDIEFDDCMVRDIYVKDFTGKPVSVKDALRSCGFVSASWQGIIFLMCLSGLVGVCAIVFCMDGEQGIILDMSSLRPRGVCAPCP